MSDKCNKCSVNFSEVKCMNTGTVSPVLKHHAKKVYRKAKIPCILHICKYETKLHASHIICITPEGKVIHIVWIGC